MKRNQCIICFERISNTKEKITTSHNTLDKRVVHSGWYHISCLKEYIEHNETNNIPKCPLCRSELIIDIPGYNYIEKKNYVNNNEFSLNDIPEVVFPRETIENDSVRMIFFATLPEGIWMLLSGPNLLLLLQIMIRYGSDAYVCLYLYTLYTSMLIAYSKYRNNQQDIRVLIKSWVNMNKLIIILIWLEALYSSTQHIVNKIVYDNDMGYYEEYEEYEEGILECEMI
jgi:hypothetical protein